MGVEGFAGWLTEAADSAMLNCGLSIWLNVCSAKNSESVSVDGSLGVDYIIMMEWFEAMSSGQPPSDCSCLCASRGWCVRTNLARNAELKVGATTSFRVANWPGILDFAMHCCTFREE